MGEGWVSGGRVQADARHGPKILYDFILYCLPASRLPSQRGLSFLYKGMFSYILFPLWSQSTHIDYFRTGPTLEATKPISACCVVVYCFPPPTRSALPIRAFFALE